MVSSKEETIARIKAAFKFLFFSSLMFKARVENFVFLPLDGGDLTISVKLVASKMIGLDDVPSTSSDSVASSSCEEDIHELYD